MFCKYRLRAAFLKALNTCISSSFISPKNWYSESVVKPHVPVMVNELLHHLNPKPGQVYLDMTFGAGGHTMALFEACPDLTVYALDQDPAAIHYANELASKLSGEVGERISETMCPSHSLDGVIMDLGASSMQMDSPERGFGLSKDSFLDMRMTGISRPDDMTAADVLGTLSASELSHIFKAYGEERFARRIANAIVDHRATIGPIRSTGQLADLIASVVSYTRKPSHNSSQNDTDDKLVQDPNNYSHMHVATRVFQALRIFVNNELNELCCGLETALVLLKTGGRVAVISFHSLEDRIVKWAFANSEKDGLGLAKRLESISLEGKGASHLFSEFHDDDANISSEESNNGNKFWVPVGGILCPSDAEVLRNRRSRSAKLRVAEKL